MAQLYSQKGELGFSCQWKITLLFSIHFFSFLSFHRHRCLASTKGKIKVGQPFFLGCFQPQWD